MSKLRITWIKSDIGYESSQRKTIKSLGTSNHINVAKATMQALSELKIPKDELAKRKTTLSAGEAAASE